MVPDVQNLIALPPGYRLVEYRIERYLGSGGFGITYSAIDEHLDHRVAIKEYLPSGLAVRNANDRVTVATAEDEADFRWGLDRFLDEARSLARFDHPNIVRVKRFLEAHGTGYIVMEYVDGEPLSEMLKRKPTLTEAEIREHVLPLTAGLARVHADGLLHRDIKPGNIMVRADGVPVLIDFGSARRAVSTKSRSLTAVITPGYAPLEQYSSTMGDQRPTTDIYALGAVLYRCVTGKAPRDATERALEDRLSPAAEAADGVFYSEGLLIAIDAALAMRADDRPRDIAAFLQLVLAGDNRRERPEYAGERSGRTGRARGFGPDDGLAGKGSKFSSKPRSISSTGKPAKRAFVATAAIVGVFVVVAILFFAALNSGKWVDSELAPAQDLSTARNDPAEAVGNALPTADNERAIADAFDAAMNAYDRKEYEFALREFSRLALLGHSEAQFRLGIMYDNGVGVSEDDAQAVQWYTRAAEQGHARAQGHLGYRYRVGEGVPEDHTQAVQWLTRAAEQGDAHSQFWLAGMYRSGEGVAEDQTQAVRWYIRAAEQGMLIALHTLNLVYVEGLFGVPDDDAHAQAVQWFTRAAEQGHAYAQTVLGDMYADGYGVLDDDAQAVQWYTRAAEQGYNTAQYLLGNMYYNGEGVLRHYGQAVQWYTRAAEQGIPGAQVSLGRMYANGEGVGVDDVQAYAWADLASVDGSPDAVTLRDGIARRLSGAELTEAQQLSRELEARIQNSR